MGVLLTIAAIVVSGTAGVAAERRWPATAAGWARRLLVISLYTLVPFVVFFNLARVHFTADLGGGLVIGWVAILIATGVAWLIGDRVLRLARPSTGSLITGTLVPNSGYLGYPLVASLLGFDELSAAVVYDIFVAVPCVLLLGFATGAAFGTKAGESPRARLVAFFTRNPPLYAAVAGLLVPNSLAPDVLVDISRGLVIALLPIGFFAVGAMLAQEAEGKVAVLGSPLERPLAAGILLRLVIAPGLLLLLSLPFIDLPDPYLLLAAMPWGINTVLIAHVYGLDHVLAARGVAWSTLVALVPILVLAFV